MIQLGGDVGEDSWRSSRCQRLYLQPTLIRSFLIDGVCLLYLGGSSVSVKVGRTRWASDVCILCSSEGGEGAGSWVILYRKPEMVVGCM